jgi:hypothetical protein
MWKEAVEVYVIWHVAGEIGTLRRELFAEIGDIGRSRGYSQRLGVFVEVGDIYRDRGYS